MAIDFSKYGTVKPAGTAAPVDFSKYGTPVSSKISTPAPVLPTKYMVPETREDLKSRYAEEAKVSQAESDRLNSPVEKFIRPVADSLLPGAASLGDTVGSIANTKKASENYESISKSLSDANVSLAKTIRERSAKGVNTDDLKRQYNKNIDFLEREKKEFERITGGSQKSTKKVAGELGMTALNILTAGNYGRATAAIKTGQMSPLLMKAPTAASAYLQTITKPSGLFTRQGLKRVSLGAGIGEAYDITQNLQDEEEGSDILTKGYAKYVAAGLPLIAGAATSISNKVGSAGLRNELGNIYRKVAAKYVKSQTVLERAESQHGSDPVGVLQMYGKETVPEMVGGGASTENARDFLNKKIKEVSELRNEQLFLNENRVQIPEYRQYANDLIDAMPGWPKEKKDRILAEVNKIIDETEVSYPTKEGSQGIELGELGKIKTDQTALSRSYNNKAPKFDYDAHAIAGKAARDLIELLGDDVAVNDLNRLIQSHYDAIDLLKALEGKKVHGGAMSGMLTRIGGNIAGSAVGSAVGHPFLGASAGHMIAGQVSDIVQSQFITNPIKRMMINMLKAKAPKEVEAAKKALEAKYGEVFEELFPTTKPATVNKEVKKGGLFDFPNKEGGFVATAYKEEGPLTTKILKDLEGKTTVSKQYILDATNRGELKQAERDITRQVLDAMPDGQINVKEFADKIKSELLPLEIANPKILGTPRKLRYESVALPDEIRGDVKDYDEHIFESPIKTSAGGTHFSGFSDNYFGHTRIEDMADNKTRRVIEVQSDLYQKGGLERDRMAGRTPSNTPAENARLDELDKLKQYNDPTAHFRMIREEIKKAAQDGKTKLQFPTGETAMKIEGLDAPQESWKIVGKQGKTPQGGSYDMYLGPDGEPTVGMHTQNTRTKQDWIVTEVLGDGKFNAVPADVYKRLKKVEQVQPNNKWVAETPGGVREAFDSKEEAQKWLMGTREESFDVSGKVDSNNPIFKFYEKDVQKYLKKYNGKLVTDDNGVSWIEVPITKEHDVPVEAFGKSTTGVLLPIAGATAVGAAAYANKDMSKEEIINKPIEKEPTDIMVDATLKDKHGEIYKLSTGVEVRPPSSDLQKAIDKVYATSENVPPGLPEAILMKESSMGTNSSNKNDSIGKFAWLVGFTEIAKKELERKGIKFNLNTKAGAIKASVDFWNSFKEGDPTEKYDKIYSSGKLKPKDLEQFKNMLAYYANEL